MVLDCLYPISTQKEHPAVIKQLSNLPVIGNAVFGVSGLSTLNIAAVREGISDIYVFDLASSVSHFWAQILPILATNVEADQAARKIEEVLATDASIYFSQAKIRLPFNSRSLEDKVLKTAELAIAGLRREIEAGTSFLSDPDRYSRIHRLAKEGRIHFTQGDLADPRNKSRILTYFMDNGVIFDTIYLSNIFYCLQDLRSLEAFPKFVEGLKNLNASTIPHEISEDTHGRQHLIKGRGVFFTDSLADV
jgi:light-regulated signal transduction histidine kinase (bacteriophytochrome)